MLREIACIKMAEVVAKRHVEWYRMCAGILTINLFIIARPD